MHRTQPKRPDERPAVHDWQHPITFEPDGGQDDDLLAELGVERPALGHAAGHPVGHPVGTASGQVPEARNGSFTAAALHGAPAMPATSMIEDGDQLAEDRQTLRDLGIPAAWTRRLQPGDRFTSVLGILDRMPQLDVSADSAVIAVVGPPDVVQLSVPARRTVAGPLGVRVHRRRDFDRVVRPAASPPRLRFEANLLDAADLAETVDAMLSLVFAATQTRFTTADRLRRELATRPRHRWRRLLGEVLADVADGVASPLERRYLRDVERPHGLPPSKRNRPEKDSSGRSRYTDVRYLRWRTRVELDGRGAHPVVERFRDWRRDNRHTVAEEAVLRYGWQDVAGAGCQVALQVVTVLNHRGWRGRLRRCPQCPIP